MRVFFLKIFIVFVVALAATSSRAAEIKNIQVRASDHNGYTRVVFEWPEMVSYTIEKQEGDKISIKFNAAAKVELQGLSENGRGNIRSFLISSNDPLYLSLGLGDKKQFRHLKLGKRVVVDIYGSVKAGDNPPLDDIEPSPEEQEQVDKETQKHAEIQEKSSEKSVSESIDEKINAEPPALPEEPEDQRIIGEASLEAARKELENMAVRMEAESGEKDPQIHVGPATGHAKGKDHEKQIEEEARERKKNLAINAGKSNLITISGTKAMGMAVFENEGRIYMLNDMPGLYLKPQVRGPESEVILPIHKTDVGGAVVFDVTMPDEMYIRTQGGGVLWRVIVGHAESKYDEILPERVEAEEGRMIVWPFRSARKVIDLKDPVTGVVLKAVTVESASDNVRRPMSFVEFDVLPSPAGIVIRPKVDDLHVVVNQNGGVEVSRPNGLAIVTQKMAKQALSRGEDKRIVVVDPDQRLFDFKGWQMGGAEAVTQNRTIILSTLPEESKAMQVEGLLTLARMFSANAQGSEALGFLSLARSIVPEIGRSPDFIALRGAARALSGRYEDAFKDLSLEELSAVKEVRFWRTFALAGLEDWQQAEITMPKDIDILYDYPALVLNRIGTVLIEVSLRAGNVNVAEDLIELLSDYEETMFPEQLAALNYLKGERQRQLGNVEETIKLWKPLFKGADERYRVKGGLALTRLQLEQGIISNAKAIDNLELLRYAWRGDQTEAQVNYWLGQAYFENGEYARGLNIMRDAAIFAHGSDLGKRIAKTMTDIFTDLFLGENLKEASPLDAAALYEQFPELLPSGKEGDLVVQKLAERMVQADLLDRATVLLEQQLNHRLSGAEAFRVGTRLSAIYLLDNNPAKALETIEKVISIYSTLPQAEKTSERQQEIWLLEARALSRQGRPDQALVLLRDMNQDPAVNRLRADIAWSAGYWDDAAEAIGDVIVDQNISLSRPLNEENTNLILQRVVALNLANDRVALASMKEKYSALIQKTDKAELFDVVTRPRRTGVLADRKTLLSSVSEVDLFADFLNNYKSSMTPSN